MKSWIYFPLTLNLCNFSCRIRIHQMMKKIWCRTRYVPEILEWKVFKNILLCRFIRPVVILAFGSRLLWDSILSLESSSSWMMSVDLEVELLLWLMVLQESFMSWSIVFRKIRIDKCTTRDEVRHLILIIYIVTKTLKVLSHEIIWNIHRGKLISIK